MFEAALGRLVNGALWGLGAGLVLTAIRGGEASDDGARGARPVAKTLMKAYVTVSERVRESAAEARESLEDLYAEARAERHAAEADGTAGGAPGEVSKTAKTPAAARSRRRRASA